MKEKQNIQDMKFPKKRASKKIRQEERKQEDRHLGLTILTGYLLIAGAFLFFVVSFYSIMISKFMPDTGNIILDWIKYDEYFCFVIPALIPLCIIFIFLNWYFMKKFRHS